MNDSSTDSRGRMRRGKAVFRISFPPPTTERAPRETDVLTSRKAKSAEHEVREEDRPPSAAPDDVHEGEVDDPQHHGVEDQPELPEGRVEVLGAQVRPCELVEELPPRPERPEVGAEGRQPDLVRLVDVVLAAEVVARAARLGDGAQRGRS